MATTDKQLVKRFNATVQSAKHRNIDFDMSLKELRRLMNRKTCHFTKVKFKPEGQLKMSLDRLDNTKGYIDGNVVACTVAINGLKANATLKEIEQIFNGIKHLL